MKVFFDHITGFGKIKHMDFIMSEPYGILEANESEEDAILQGWVPWSDGRWYNIRNVRINLQEYKPSKTTKKLAKRVIVKAGNIEANLEKYRLLYSKYCEYHKFQRIIEFDDFKECSVIEYWDGDLIGISLYQVFGKQLIVYEFIWNYHDPKLSLGTIAQMTECETAKVLNCEYVYLLGGYELCCLYKSNFKGFEFWTGNEWSKNVELYKQLIERDELIKIENYDF